MDLSLSSYECLCDAMESTSRTNYFICSFFWKINHCWTQAGFLNINKVRIMNAILFIAGCCVPRIYRLCISRERCKNSLKPTRNLYKAFLKWRTQWISSVFIEILSLNNKNFNLYDRTSYLIPIIECKILVWLKIRICFFID